MESLNRVALICSLMFIIILFSGCTAEDLPIGGEFCAKIGLCEKKVVEERPEVIIIKEIKVLPSKEVKANEDVDVYITLKNKDSEKELKDVEAKISNPGDFGCKNPTNCLYKLTMHPLQEKTLHFKLKAPNFQGTMHIPETLTFSVSFKYDSHTTKSVWLIGKEKYKKYLEAGRRVPTTLSESKSKGPVRIDLSIDAEQPVSIDMDGKKINLYLQMNNAMDGIVSEFDSLDLSINCPPGEASLQFSDWDNETFSGTTTDLHCHKKTEIAFYGKSSPKYYFVLNAAGNENSEVTQCTVSADAIYKYEISRNFEIVIEGSSG